ncbi:MAG: hypothetical protein FWG88_06690 [Oscillospiraceae bacterium]|nr:hypothetical protein [Oscillospiraceae bacterium]
MARYVPKTYNNRRILRIIIGAATSVVLAITILFVVLFFSLRPYFVTYEDGTQRLEIPWLMEER